MNQATNQTVAQIKLRAWQETDLPFLMRLRNDVALQARLLATARGSDEDAVRAWLMRRTEGAGRIFQVIADRVNGDPIGYLQADLSDGQADGWSFGICVDDPFQGSGRGTSALIALEDELARHFGARSLTLEVDRANERAVRCYKRLGYEECEAAPRQVMVCDQPREVIVMAKLLAPTESRP